MPVSSNEHVQFVLTGKKTKSRAKCLMYLGYIIIALNCLGFLGAVAGMLGFETESHYKENKTMKELMTKW